MPAPRLVADLLDLVLGHCCIGCSRVDGVLCTECERELSAQSPRAIVVPGPPAICAHEYADLAQVAVIAHKEHGLRALAPILGRHLARAVTHGLTDAAPPTRPIRGICLVPIPGHANRPYDHAGALARQAAGSLRSAGIDAVSAAVLASQGHRSLKLLSKHERARAVRGAFAVRAPRGPLPGLIHGRLVVVIDDVITTGATTAEAARTLTGAGLPVDLVASFAATPRPH